MRLEGVIKRERKGEIEGVIKRERDGGVIKIERGRERE